MSDIAGTWLNCERCCIIYSGRENLQVCLIYISIKKKFFYFTIIDCNLLGIYVLLSFFLKPYL